MEESAVQHKVWLADQLNGDRTSADSTCDLILTSEGQEFRVHKNVMMLVSNYFKKMFTIEMVEKYKESVDMKKIPPQRLAKIINFIYSGKIEITEENVLDIVHDAEYTENEALKSHCCSFMLDAINVENCLTFRMCAQQYNLDEVLIKTNQTIVENLAEIALLDDFLQFEVDDVTAVINQKNKSCEEGAFFAIVGWVNYNPCDREKFFLKLFSLLDLNALRTNFLLNQVFEENLVQNNVCLHLLGDAFRKCTKLHCTDNFILIAGKNLMTDCVIYDMITRKSKQLPKLNSGRVYACAVKFGSKIYSLGGAEDKGGSNACSTVEMFDLDEPTEWNKLPEMLQTRVKCGAQHMKSEIFVVGGINKLFGTLSSCEKFDMKTNKWTSIPNLLVGRFDHGTANLRSVLYCVGGYDGEKDLSSCERYDEEIGEWNEITPLNQARRCLICVVLDEHIYAIGGHNINWLSSVECYEPESNQWKFVAPLNVARCYASACVVGNKIVVVGGNNAKQLKSVEVYDPTDNTWTLTFEIDQPVTGASAVV